MGVLGGATRCWSALIITLERGLAAKPGGGMRRFVRIGLTTAKKEESNDTK